MRPATKNVKQMDNKPRSRKKRRSMTLPFLIIMLACLFVFGCIKLYQRYSFTKEKANLEEYLGVKDNEVAIYINDVLEKKIDKDDTLNYKGLCESEAAYLPLSFVKAKLNNRFYYEEDIKKVLYSLPDKTKNYSENDIEQVANAPYVLIKEEPYLLVNFVKEYTNIRFDQYLDNNYKRLYIYTNWDKIEKANVKSIEAARWKGGNKSPIIVECKKGEEVKILDRMTKWCKVKTESGYIGYIRNTKIGTSREEIPKSDYVEQVREHFKLKEKVCLGFHQLFSINHGKNMDTVAKNATGMNVIAPTWYVLKDNEGGIRSVASPQYSNEAHRRGYKVWATLNNFDVTNVNEKKIFGSALIRRKIITRLMREVDENYLDGINLDIEGLSEDAGEDYTQFVRELSIACREKKITLSIDTFVPYSFNDHYNLKEYNFFCDYIIVMCYDEHYKGSKEAGSVSSIGFIKDGINLTLDKNVDRDKLVVGLAFYTRIWTTDKKGRLSSSVMDADKAYQSALKQELEFTYDEQTGQNYGVKTTEDGEKIEVWLEDETSLNDKMVEITDQDVAGTAAWKLTQQKPLFFSIINMN